MDAELAPPWWPRWEPSSRRQWRTRRRSGSTTTERNAQPRRTSRSRPRSTPRHPATRSSICPGTYVEGSGDTGSNALTITKSLTLKGAGADLVSIMPPQGRADHRGRAGHPQRRRRHHHVVGDKPRCRSRSTSPASPSTATAPSSRPASSSWTPRARSTAAAIKNVVTSELAADFSKPGGFRGPQFGYGIAQVTANTVAPPAEHRAHADGLASPGSSGTTASAS